jgi:hypothetical protein
MGFNIFIINLLFKPYKMAKQMLSEEFRRMQKLAGIITENNLGEIFNFSKPKPTPDPHSKEEHDRLASYLTYGMEDKIIPGSNGYTYGPDEKMGYRYEYKLALDADDLHYGNTPEEEAIYLQNDMNPRRPSAADPNTAKVTYEGEENGKYIFHVVITNNI